MSLSPDLPPEDIALVLGFLLPLVPPGVCGDPGAAERLLLRLLADYHPRDTRELHLAAEAVGINLRCMTSLAVCGTPNLRPEARDRFDRWVLVFSRQGLQVQKRLEALQRPPGTRAARTRNDIAEAAPESEPQADAPPSSAPSAAELDAGTTNPPPVAVRVPATHPAAASEVTAAEVTYSKALRLLTLMKQHINGTPPPGSKAAQDIQQQQQIVDMARMSLEHARRQGTDAAATDMPQRTVAGRGSAA